VNQGKLVADGAVGELLAGSAALSTYSVEAEGDGIANALAALPGVETHSVETVDGRVRVRLTVRSAEDLRPRIHALASDQGWTLWELHRERASLEQMFRQLTVGTDATETAE
jgi:ABC-2 type transport system ATP-binding protein